MALTDEAWAVPVVEALTEALRRTGSAPVRGRIVANLSGLYRRYPDWSGSWFGTNPLAGRFPEKTQDWSPEGMEGVLRGLAPGFGRPRQLGSVPGDRRLESGGSGRAPLLRPADQGA
jgi:hypothetical protein